MKRATAKQLEAIKHGVRAAEEAFENELWHLRDVSQENAHKQIYDVPMYQNRELLLHSLSTWGRELGLIAARWLAEFYDLANHHGHSDALTFAKSQVDKILSHHLGPRDDPAGILSWIAYVCEGQENFDARDQERWNAPSWISEQSGLAPAPLLSRSSRYDPLETKQIVRKLYKLVFFRLTEALDDAALRLRVRMAKMSVSTLQSQRGVTSTRRKVDVRKGEIANLKREQPNISAEKICRRLDRLQDRNPAFRPLTTWEKKAGTRLWLSILRNPKTRNAVESYISKIKP